MTTQSCKTEMSVWLTKVSNSLVKTISAKFNINENETKHFQKSLSLKEVKCPSLSAQHRHSIPSQDIQGILLSELAPLSFCSVSAPSELSWSCGVLPHCRIQPYKRNLLSDGRVCWDLADRLQSLFLLLEKEDLLEIRSCGEAASKLIPKVFILAFKWIVF